MIVPRVPLPVLHTAGLILGRVALDPVVPVSWQRACTDITGKLSPAPTGVHRSDGTLGGRPVSTSPNSRRG